MRSRSTITAALALAAVTILAVAACGSSVTGAAQANSAAAELQSALDSVELSIPSELTDQTAVPTDLDALTSMLGELPTELSVPSELSDLPTDLSFPSDLSDLTDLSIPGYNGDCIAVASAYASVTFALLPVLFGGSEQFDAGELQATLDSLSGSVPPELAGDIQTLTDLAAQSSGKSLTEASELLDSQEWTTASDNIDAWITANCGG
jgi:hypothetical protein